MKGLLSHRIILVSGKGGVGRSVMTASIARAGAFVGRRMLVTDLEEPNSERRSALAALLGRYSLPRNPISVGPGIDGVLVQTEYGTELFLRSLFKAGPLVALAMRSKSLQRLLHAAPSFREMGMFFHLLHLATAKDDTGRPAYDHIVVDMPATGHALAMTGLPEIMLQLVPTGPIAEAFRQGRAIFHDSSTTTAWVVTLPETLPVSEALELLEGLAATDVPVSGVLVNRVPPNPFTDEERKGLLEAIDGRRFFGRRSLERIGQSRDSLQRLVDNVSVPVLTMPELSCDVDDLLDSLARRIVAGAA